MRQPRAKPEAVYFNALKGQFKTKEHYLMFNQIKKQERKPVTKAKLKTLFSLEEASGVRISEKNIYCARKGAQALMHPLFRKLYTFGGVGRCAIADLEAFDEESLEFAKLTKHSTRASLGV